MSYKDLTKEKLGKLISKPKLKDERLAKPPFAFIHDICTSIRKETGFLEGIWSDEKLNRKNECFRGKKVKASFLKELILAIEVTLEIKLDAKISNILSGKKAEHTNQMFQALADAALRIKSGELCMNQIKKWMENPDAPREQKQSAEASVEKSEEISATKAQPSSETIKHEPRQSPDLSSIEYVRKSQETLCLLLAKPPLKEKYLAKPAVRYLIDICAAVNKESGIFKLIDPNVLNSKKLKSLSGDAKKKFQQNFVKEVIAALKEMTGADIDVQANSVLRGAEPEKTNAMLCLMAGIALGTWKATAEEPKQEEKAAEADDKKKVEAKPAKKEAVKSLKKEKKENKKKEKKRKTDKVAAKSRKKAGKANKVEQTSNKEEKKSDVKTEVEKTDIKATVQSVSDVVGLPPRPPSKSSRESNRNLIARQGPPGSRGKSHTADRSRSRTPNKIISDGSTDEDLEVDEGFDPPVDIPVSMQEQGKLVRDLMGSAGERAQSAKSTESFRGEEQINHLRDQIQKICTSVIPLGKCIDFVFEDIERMKKDYAKYRSQCEAHQTALKEAEKGTETHLTSLNKTLQNRLQEKENLIKQIYEKKAVISQNRENQMGKMKLMIGLSA